MKTLILFVSFAVVAAACNTTPKAEVAATAPVVTALPDTAGLAQFQDWKAQNELAAATAYKATQPATTVVYAAAPQKTYTAKRSTASRPSTANRGVSRSSNAGTESGTMASESSRTAKKRGISKAAKGAIIGGVAGAAGGAIINKKNRAAGAVIGGVIGAGGGYVIGRKMDKKDGRIDLVPVTY